MDAQKFIKFDVFLNHANMTAITIKCNKIVSNEVEDNQTLSRSKLNKLFG